MIALPNPFEPATAPAMVAGAAAAPDLSDPPAAAADQFDGPDIPLDELTRRGFDVWKFDDLIPVLKVLAGDSFMADIEPIRAAIARH